ncbi:MAG: hypothetical protein ACRYGR_09735 [Janthinobacterium lividum]
MKNLYKWIMLGALLVNQFSMQATDQADKDESKWELVKKKLEEFVPIDASMFKLLLDKEDELRLTDEEVSLAMKNFIRPHHEKMELFRLGKKALKAFDLKDQCLTDSGAISLACLFDSIKNVAAIDIWHNQIGSLGIQAIFTKACGDYVIKSRDYKIPFIFRFTASEDIKPELEAIALNHNKSLSWKLQIPFLENRYDFQVTSEDKNPESTLKSNVDFQQSVKDNAKLSRDEEVVEVIKHYIRPYSSVGPKDTSKIIDFSDNDLTDWTAISFACAFDYLKELEQFNVCHNKIGEVGIQAILTKIFTAKDFFTFSFTATKDITGKVDKLTKKYNKSLTWSTETFWKEDLYDYEVIIMDKDFQISESK